MRRMLTVLAAGVTMLVLSTASAVTIESVSRDGAGIPKEITVSLSASASGTKLCLAWGAVDQLGKLAAWENVCCLCDVAANATSATVSIPEDLREQLSRAKVYRIFHVTGGGRLGAGYAEIPYLETDGKQSINTGFTPTPNTACTVDMAPSHVGGNKQNYFFGSRSSDMASDANKSFFEFTLNGGGNFYLCLHDCTSTAFLNTGKVATKGERYLCVVDAKSPKFTISAGKTVSDYTSNLKAMNWSMTKSAKDVLSLFGSTFFATDDVRFRGKFYSCQVTEDGATVRDFVPCVRVSDGVLGVYDVSGQSASPFYGNVDSAAFVNQPTALSQIVDESAVEYTAVNVIAPIAIANVQRNQGVPVSAQVVYAAASEAGRLALAWSTERDGGDSLAGWDNVRLLGTIAAGATSDTIFIPSDVQSQLKDRGVFRLFRIGCGRLSEGYAEIPCLETDGRQSINTGFTPTPNTACTIDMEPSRVGGGQQNTFFASRSLGMLDTTAEQSYFELTINGGGYFNLCLHDVFLAGTRSTEFLNVNHLAVKDKRYVCTVDAKTPGYVIGGTDYTSQLTAKTAWTRTKNAQEALSIFGAPIFGTGTFGDARFRGKFYSCQVTENGATVRDFVPCVRLSDGVLGVYDMSGQSKEPFYGNADSAAFVNQATAISQVVRGTSASACVFPEVALSVTRLHKVNGAIETVDIAFTGSTVARKMWLLWSDKSDLGDDFGSWANRVELDDIEPGAVRKSVEFPSEVAEALKNGGGFRLALKSSDRLPAAYAEITYLETDGKQSINTGFTPTPNTACTIDMEPSRVGGGQQNTFFASRSLGMLDTTAEQSYFELTINGSGYFNLCLHDVFLAGTRSTEFLNVNHLAVKDRRYVCTVDAKTPGYVIGGTDYTSQLTAKTAWTRTKNAQEALSIFGSPIFGTGTFGDARFRGKFYSCQVTENGATVRDFVPCVRLSDGVLGVYDMSGQSEEPFYGNADSAAFVNQATAMTQLVDVELSAYTPSRRGLFVVVK